MEQGTLLGTVVHGNLLRILEYGVLLSMLGCYAVEDLRKHTITLRYLICFGAIGMMMHVLKRDVSIVNLLLGIAVGLGLILLSFLTRGSIGMGDGCLFFVTGIFLGGSNNAELLLTSLLYAAVVSLGILFFGRGKRNREIPFIPFVFLGYLTMIVEAHW